MVGVETAYTVRSTKTDEKELQAFFNGDNAQQEEVGGWDD